MQEAEYVPEDRSHRVTAPPPIKKDGSMGGLAKIASGAFFDEIESSATDTHCEVDGLLIKVMSFKGTGVCSELCRKRRDNELSEERYAELRSAHPGS